MNSRLGGKPTYRKTVLAIIVQSGGIAQKSDVEQKFLAAHEGCDPALFNRTIHQMKHDKQLKYTIKPGVKEYPIRLSNMSLLKAPIQTDATTPAATPNLPARTRRGRGRPAAMSGLEPPERQHRPGTGIFLDDDGQVTLYADGQEVRFKRERYAKVADFMALLSGRR